jgi:purine nucleosidase
MRKLLIDTDTAADDALALMMALYHPDAEVLAVTINCGNMDFDQMVENALYTVEVAGQGGQVPVYPGCRQPLMGQYRSVPEVFGQDGMGNAFFPKARQRAENRHAVDVIVELANAHPGELEIVALAPVTNIAVALTRDPTIARKLKAIYFMGGTLYAMGNMSMGAEFNVWVDPEAARILFRSGANVILTPWEVARDHAYVTQDERGRIASLDTITSRFYMQVTHVLNEHNRNVDGAPGTIHADCIGMAVPLFPELVTERRGMFADVELGGELARGVTFLDWTGLTGNPANLDVVFRTDRERFADRMLQFVSTR